MKGTTVGQTTCCLLKAKSVFLPATLEGEARSLPFYSCNTLPAWSLSKNSGQSRHFWQSVLEGIHGVALVIHRERVKCEVRQFEPSLLVNHCVKRTWLFCLISLFGSGVSNTPNQRFVLRILRHLLTTPALLTIALGDAHPPQRICSVSLSPPQPDPSEVWNAFLPAPRPGGWKEGKNWKL